MKAKLGTLKRLKPRDIWASESKDFTPWLAQNIGALGTALGLDLEVLKTEAAVGDFSVDILARDLSTARDVVIENQFGATDHDHLGKLLTYASGVEAFALVWIAETIRDEHRQALEWLNERTQEDTYLFALELEVLQIDDSAPAFNFKPIVFPNKWQKATKTAARSGSSPRGEAYKQFFQRLIDELREKHRFTGARVAFPQNWYTFASGIGGVSYGASFAQGDRVRVEIYLGSADADANKKMFDWLLEQKAEIEAKFGAALEWERLDNRRASRIAIYRSGTIDSEDTVLEEIHSWTVKQLLAFRDIFATKLKHYQK